MSLVVQGEVENVVYRNPENNYTVLRLRLEGRQGLATAVGHLHEVACGEFLRLTGDWVSHKRYGEQFKVERYETVAPTSQSGIERFLASGLLKGIGPELARRITAAFGEQTFEVLDTQIERLLEVEGIGEIRLGQIAANWHEHQQTRSIMFGLQEMGVSIAYATRIFKKYGAESLAVVSANPYVLAEEIFGIGFKRADAIAMHLGIERDAALRLQAGVVYTLTQFVEEGHVYCPYETLIERAQSLLGCEREAVAMAVAQEVQARHLLIVDLNLDAEQPQVNHKAVYLPFLYHAETAIAERLAKLLRADCPLVIDEEERVMAACLDGWSIELAPAQRRAIAAALREKLLIITGGPGTGKTTIVNAIITIFQAYRARILLAAPTGRAAKRLTETTGREARTIHMLLEYTFQAGFQRHAKRPLEADLLIIDEASMIDTSLMHHLLKAIPAQARLILVGDVNQLPSVGPGNILHDLISSQRLRVTELHDIFRQEARSLIVLNAHRINEGRLPVYDVEGGERLADFFFIEEEDAAKVLEVVKRLCSERIPEKFQLHPTHDIQVMTPMYKGLVGVDNLNSELQALFNPNAPPVATGRGNLRLGDKVMQIRNNYEKGVFNGDIGWVAEVRGEDELLRIDFDDRAVTYEFGDLNEVVLAYAVSVHKAQGSEYPAVVLPLLPQHYLLLQRNLLYTAVTRARQLVVIVGSKKALAMAVQNDRVMHRYTGLERWLREEVAPLADPQLLR
ncbi:MAG: ATP-dependent RecD-like DNA helicase [Candidatus Tectomicrobia bacterium]|nr:ATP-dependent RecD-like DNA helicase [Candidatus Tectomicrobia bacterium]